MAFGEMLQRMFWPAPRPPGPPRLRPGRAATIVVGGRVRLRIPLASAHTVHIAAGAAGVIVGGDPRARQVTVELDAPRTRITVPWTWVEDEPEPEESSEATPGPTPG